MHKMPHLILLTMLLSVMVATAQPGPIVNIEHDWTFKTGNKWYGLYQIRIRGDVRSSTTVFFGRRWFTVRLPAGLLIAAVAAPVAIGVFLFLRREPKSG